MHDIHKNLIFHEKVINEYCLYKFPHEITKKIE